MSEYEKTDQPGLLIDRSTGTVINTNTGAYEAIKAARKAKRERDGLVDRVAELERKVQELQDTLGRISPIPT